MDFQPRASHLVSASREVTLESQLYDLIRLLQGYWTTSSQKTRTLERRYAPEQGTWHRKCPLVCSLLSRLKYMMLCLIDKSLGIQLQSLNFFGAAG